MSMRRSAALLIARSHRWCHVIHTAVRRGKYCQTSPHGPPPPPKIALVHLPSYQFKWRRLSCARFDCLPRLHYRLRERQTDSERAPGLSLLLASGCYSCSPSSPPSSSFLPPFIYRLVTFSNRTESLRQFCECLAQCESNSNLRSLRLSIVALGLSFSQSIPCNFQLSRGILAASEKKTD